MDTSPRPDPWTQVVRLSVGAIVGALLAIPVAWVLWRFRGSTVSGFMDRLALTMLVGAVVGAWLCRRGGPLP